jgi:hypothetical protein
MFLLWPTLYADIVRKDPAAYPQDWPAMTRDCRSCLLRCWWLLDRTQRTRIEHFQVGERVDADAPAAALALISLQRAPT